MLSVSQNHYYIYILWGNCWWCRGSDIFYLMVSLYIINLFHHIIIFLVSLMFPGLQITQYTLFSQTATRCKHGRLVLFTSNYHITILSLRSHIAAQPGFHFVLMKTYSWYIFTKWLIFQMAQADKPKDLSKRDMLLQSNSITHNPNLQREFHLHLPHHPNTR